MIVNDVEFRVLPEGGRLYRQHNNEWQVLCVECVGWHRSQLTLRAVDQAKLQPPTVADWQRLLVAYHGTKLLLPYVPPYVLAEGQP